jgi:hypothetical protein
MLAWGISRVAASRSGTCPHGSALGSVAGLAPPSVRVEWTFLTDRGVTDLYPAPAVGAEGPKTLVPGAPGPHCRDMSRAVRPARGRG